LMEKRKALDTFCCTLHWLDAWGSWKENKMRTTTITSQRAINHYFHLFKDYAYLWLRHNSKGLCMQLRLIWIHISIIGLISRGS
jgi:hypothetical protein